MDTHQGDSKRTLRKKLKRSPQRATGGYLGNSNPEGNADRTSLGGWQRNLKLKFGKNLLKIGGGVKFNRQSQGGRQKLL